MTFSSTRQAAGYSIDDVSREFAVSEATVREWEDGAVAPERVTRTLAVIGRLDPAPEDDVPAAAPTVKARRRAKTPGEPSSALIKSKRRVADHGEVFTPAWLVEKMLDLVKGETERIDSRFLEPACGSGNFLVPILQRKLAAVELKYGRSEFEKRHHALQALTCCYGIELLADNVAECRAKMLAVFATYLDLDPGEDLHRAAEHVLSLNLIHGDAMKMVGADGAPILVVEWGYLGRGKFNRRDFRLDRLTQAASLREERSLFAGLGNHEVFKAVASYPPMTVRELADGDGAERPA